MPGHKGKPLAQAEELLGSSLYAADVTEIPGTDDLHNPQECIAHSERLTAKAFGAKASFFLINGASAGIHAAFLLAAGPGKKVLVPRHSHKSVMSALMLSGAKPLFIPVEIHPKYGFALGINSKNLECQEEDNIDAVFNVRPTYEGVVEPLVQFAKAGEDYTQIVDEAHGAHFGFNELLPETALASGGDLVIQGTHKTLGSLTQTGLLHSGGRFAVQDIRKVLSLLQSTSPSYILMASLELMRLNLEVAGTTLLMNCIELARVFREKISAIEGFYCLKAEDVYPRELDVTKVVFGFYKMSGYQLAKVLREDYKIQVEMAAERYVLAMITTNDTREDIAQILRALTDLAQRFKDLTYKSPPMLLPLAVPPLKILPRQALFAAKRMVKIEEARGLVSAEAFCPYPPGIPLIYPGELITEEIIDYINYYKNIGAHWQGCVDPELKTIMVVDQ